MDFSEMAACGTDTAEVVRGGNVYTSIKCAPFIDCYVIIIIGKGKTSVTIFLTRRNKPSVRLSISPYSIFTSHPC